MLRILDFRKWVFQLSDSIISGELRPQTPHEQNPLVSHFITTFLNIYWIFNFYGNISNWLFLI